jgi:hypothetical protein
LHAAKASVTTNNVQSPLRMERITRSTIDTIEPISSRLVFQRKGRAASLRKQPSTFAQLLQGKRLLYLTIER